ncbi:MULTISPECIES: DNA internalization-related competence protein ComEC/Rec2 [unclassified Herbaspirillum]|uniref:DNA internalization-related competence protein ComEC/Rec2 n=1 Tax=unclassified Herbaspirillum TaxID=2624150 RepID=UPI00115125A8|nr:MULTISPECIES: DNA internalization-related competence protein ComEC/Rec2 [unclassified Herbaspirillum]MBB5393491.1 competence protein ComEC [Herbaspirillum sp. SJZ102]TQK03761.1 competence protein ComEC [Herbaspirillum sp. SJZ130]TQK08493.1 competence protein ComEC [Herbaspirillum sp. SJZ106]
MRSVIIGFAFGIGLLQMQARLPGVEWYAAGLVLAVLLALTAWKFWQPFLRIPLLLTCGAWVGFLWAAAFAHYYLEQELPSAWEGRDVTVIGTVANLPDRNEQGVRFRFDVEQVVQQVTQQEAVTPPVPPRLALAWYGNRRYQAPVEDGEAAAPGRQPVADIRPGERWRLTVRLKRPHGNANPGGFDYEVWLLQDDVRATGYVVGTPAAPGAAAGAANRRLDAFVWTPSNAIEYARGWLRDRILAALPGEPYAPVVAALVMGDQRGISQSDWSIFNRTGIGHLMAISGLHITMLAAMCGGLASWLWRRSFFTGAQLPLLLPAQKVAVIAGMLMALVYVLLAGFGVPAQRTLYMLIVVGVAFWSGRIVRVSVVLCLALGLVLLLDPWSLLWPGFWLSFGAVGLLLYGTVGRMQPRHAMAAAARTRWWQKLWLAVKSGAQAQYIITLGLVPLTVLLFGQYSLVSPIANAVAIPLVGLVVTPLSLLGSILPAFAAEWVLQVPHQLLVWLAGFLGWLEALPFAVWETPLPSWWMFLLALGGTLLVLAPRGWPARWLGVFGWLPLILNAPGTPAEGTMRVTAFDIGQGMGLLVETPGHRLLYDTGPYYTPQSDGATRVLLPYLRARGIDRIDRLVISHSDIDHSGGALSLLKGVRIDSVYSSLAEGSPIVKAAPSHQRCVAGQSWNWDGIGFTMLHPVPAIYESTKWKPNALSCVLKVQIGRQSILLAGDVEAIQEDQMLNGAMAEQLPSTVLLAPHHGSKTSSTEPFLRAVRPEVAIFQVGYRNRFNHPNPEVFERYQRLGIRRLRTDESGAVTLTFGDQLNVEEYRKTHARYWYGR